MYRHLEPNEGCKQRKLYNRNSIHGDSKDRMSHTGMCGNAPEFDWLELLELTTGGDRHAESDVTSGASSVSPSVRPKTQW